MGLVCFLVWDDVRVEEVASADLDCVESSFADEAADGLDVELPALGVFGDCCSVIFSVHRSYYITIQVFFQFVLYRHVVWGDALVSVVSGYKKSPTGERERGTRLGNH